MAASRQSSVVKVAVALTLAATNAIGLLRAAEPPVAVKMPPDLKHWQISVSARGVHTATYPIRVYDDGRYECELLSESLQMVTRKGTLETNERNAVLAMGRSLLSKVVFVQTGQGSDDAPRYELNVRSGSRSVHVSLDPAQPNALGLYGETRAGVDVINRVLRKYKSAPEFSRSIELLQIPVRDRPYVNVDARLVVPTRNLLWDSIMVRQRNKITWSS